MIFMFTFNTFPICMMAFYSIVSIAYSHDLSGTFLYKLFHIIDHEWNICLYISQSVPIYSMFAKVLKDRVFRI